MANYCTREDVLRRVRSLRLDEVSEPNLDDVDAWIAEASSAVDQAVAPNHAIPLEEPYPGLVVAAAASGAVAEALRATYATARVTPDAGSPPSSWRYEHDRLLAMCRAPLPGVPLRGLIGS